jgi:hypothetical protein
MHRRTWKQHIIIAVIPSTDKFKDTNAHNFTSDLTTFQFGYMAYYLNKAMEKAILDRVKFGGICGDDMFVTEGSEQLVDSSRLAGHNAHHFRLSMDPLFISTHKGNVKKSFQRIELLGKETSSLSCLKIILYDASIDDGPRTLPSGQPSIPIDGSPRQFAFKIFPAF